MCVVLLLNKWDLIDSEAKRDEVAVSVAKRLACTLDYFINVSHLLVALLIRCLPPLFGRRVPGALQLKTSELNELRPDSV